MHGSLQNLDKVQHNFVTLSHTGTTDFTGYYIRQQFITSDYRLNSFLQVMPKPFTGGAPSKNTLFIYL